MSQIWDYIRRAASRDFSIKVFQVLWRHVRCDGVLEDVSLIARSEVGRGRLTMASS